MPLFFEILASMLTVHNATGAHQSIIDNFMCSNYSLADLHKTLLSLESSPFLPEGTRQRFSSLRAEIELEMDIAQIRESEKNLDLLVSVHS